jgi:hypothetical protein
MRIEGAKGAKRAQSAMRIEGTEGAKGTDRTSRNNRAVAVRPTFAFVPSSVSSVTSVAGRFGPAILPIARSISAGRSEETTLPPRHKGHQG